jgi:hypothetical protein
MLNWTDICCMLSQCCIALHCIALHCTALQSTALWCTVLYDIVLHCTVLYCVVLYCTVYCLLLFLYCTILHKTALSYWHILHYSALYCITDQISENFHNTASLVVSSLSPLCRHLNSLFSTSVLLSIPHFLLSLALQIIHLLSSSLYTIWCHTAYHITFHTISHDISCSLLHKNKQITYRIAF